MSGENLWAIILAEKSLLHFYNIVSNLEKFKLEPTFYFTMVSLTNGRHMLNKYLFSYVFNTISTAIRWHLLKDFNILFSLVIFKLKKLQIFFQTKASICTEFDIILFIIWSYHSECDSAKKRLIHISLPLKILRNSQNFTFMFFWVRSVSLSHIYYMKANEGEKEIQ